MKQTEEYKLKKMQLAALKRSEDLALIRGILASPLVQVMGTVAAAETLEAAGILSGRWSGAIEGGVITAIFLQALKEYGLIGAGTLGLGVSLGAASEGSGGKILEGLTQGQLSGFFQGLKALGV